MLIIISSNVIACRNVGYTWSPKTCTEALDQTTDFVLEIRSSEIVSEKSLRKSDCLERLLFWKLTGKSTNHWAQLSRPSGPLNPSFWCFSNSFPRPRVGVSSIEQISNRMSLVGTLALWPWPPEPKLNVHRHLELQKVSIKLLSYKTAEGFSQAGCTKGNRITKIAKIRWSSMNILRFWKAMNHHTDFTGAVS